MHRRQFLLGTVPVTLSLAGCNAGYDGPVRTEPAETEASPSTQTSPTATPRSTPGGYWRVVSLEDQDTVADRHQVSMKATLVEPWITAEHTARIPVTLTNHASHVRTFYDYDDPEVKRGISKDEGALLAPSRFTSPPDCIGTDGRRPGPFGESAEGPAETELQPDESITIAYGVGDDPRISGCISPGTYRFRWRVTYKDAPAGEEEEDGWTTYAPIRWGLTLKVSSPR